MPTRSVPSLRCMWLTTTELKHFSPSPAPDSQCVNVNPTWSKGYARKGAALHGQRRYVEAIEAYEAGLNIEDSPALRKGLEEVKAAKGACLAFACIYPRLSLTGLAIIQRQTSAAMEQMQWASEKCLMTRACLPNLPPIHVPPSTSPMRALCKKCVYYVHASQGPRVLRSPLLAPTHTAESPTGTEPNRQRFAHD